MGKVILPALFLAVIASLSAAVLFFAPPQTLRSAVSDFFRKKVSLPSSRESKPVIIKPVILPSNRQNKPANVTPVINSQAGQINISAMSRASDPGLRKLAEYETVCSSEFGGMMIFDRLPTSVKLASGDAASMAATLKEYVALGVKPLVIIEPSDETGQTINFSKFASGYYSQALQSYFAALKLGGIGDTQMGTWVPFPEPNTDSWGKDNSNPADFAAAFNVYAAVFKKYFPGAQLSIMLDNQNYDYQTGDYKYSSLAPYVARINKSYVSSFGLQGFPWAPEAGSSDSPVTDAADFLNAGRAMEIARSLGVNSLWFNTGTYSAMYTQDPSKTVRATAVQRSAILDSILGQVSLARMAGFNVAVNIFAENKSGYQEAIDWSYWRDLADIKNPNGSALSNFAANVSKSGIFLYVFDSN